MSLFQPLPAPKTPLGYHRVLSPTAGVRVSPLCLGAMNFGEAWKEMLGECDKKTSFEMLDFFYENGGNFIDTANNYQDEESEMWIGEWMKERENRDEIVLATKFSTMFAVKGKERKLKGNFNGNHSKSLKISVENSLKKLQTHYIDVLYIHWWDWTTSIPELMQSLHHLVAAGTVLYLGVSDTPAWVVSKANEYARQKGLTQFSVYQGLWNAAKRDFERDILPMCEAEGMALAPWGALGRGQFRPAADIDKPKEGGRKSSSSEADRKISAALEKIANKKGTIITSIALAYVMHKSPYVYPIVGGRNTRHLQGNIDALTIELSDEEVDEIESAVPFDIGFPLSLLFGYPIPEQYSTRRTTADMQLVNAAVRLDIPQKTKRPQVHTEFKK